MAPGTNTSLYDRAKDTLRKFGGKLKTGQNMEYVNLGVGLIFAVVTSVTYAMSETMRATDYVIVNQLWEYDTVQKGDDYHHFAVASLDHSATWNNGTALMVLAWMMLAAPALQLIARSMGWLQYKWGYNPVRWLTDSILNPLMVVITLMFLGDTSTFGLFSAFALVHAYTIGGLLIEVINAPVSLSEAEAKKRTSDEEEAESEVKEVTATTTVTFWPVAFSGWLSLLSIVAPLTLLITTAQLRYVSSFEYVAITALLLFQSYMTTIQILYYMHLYKPTESSALFSPVGKPDGDGMPKFSPKNHDAYQKYLSGGNLILRNVVLVFLLVVATQKNFYYFPDAMQCESSYTACNPKTHADSTLTNGKLYVTDVCHDAMDKMTTMNIGSGHGVDTSNSDFTPHYSDTKVDSHAMLQASFDSDCANVWAAASSCIAFTYDGVMYKSGDTTFNMEDCCKANQKDSLKTTDGGVVTYTTQQKDSGLSYERCTCVKLTKEMTNTYGSQSKNKDLGNGKSDDDAYLMTVSLGSATIDSVVVQSTVIDYDGVKTIYTPDLIKAGAATPAGDGPADTPPARMLSAKSRRLADYPEQRDIYANVTVNRPTFSRGTFTKGKRGGKDPKKLF